MIHALTPRGTKDLFLRGWLGLRGLKGFVSGKLTTPSGSKTIWNHASAIGGGLTVTATPTFVQGAGSSPSPQPVTTASASVTVTNGSAPYGYAWTSSSPGSTDTFAPTSSTTAFVATAVEPGTSQDWVMTCTVTDARGATGTATVQVQVTNYGGAF